MSHSAVDLSAVPAHVACVMDGNGRWAAQRGLPRTAGHEAGLDALFGAVDGALEIGVQWLTVYAFSTENWRRPREEVRFLLDFNRLNLAARRHEMHQRGVRLRFIGGRDRRLPRRLLAEMDTASELTAANRRLTLTVAFNYGGRAELTEAVRKIVASGAPPGDISEATIRANLATPDMPDPDVLIRTSGEYRLSNFLLWQVAYSEMVFLDVLWPDFSREHLFEAVAEYRRRERRFGGLDQ
ncbi:MAG: di-trans,poly-cis-decaprenylcistransferase [Acidimicrobiia bacterium]|nr:di-trans,poly-cis-decaprenylcistransferase [Acidimicrobiia bacterium]